MYRVFNRRLCLTAIPFGAGALISFVNERNHHMSNCDEAETVVRRRSTRSELNVLRRQRTKIIKRWEKDEDGWRELPARAWPAYQPDPDLIGDILAKAAEKNCEEKPQDGPCAELFFQVATSKVFYQVDPQAGLKEYEKLANAGHVDSMVACGIVLIEGFGLPPQEKKGLEWLEKSVALGSAQGCYELGTALYTGIDGVIEEDPKRSFELFEQGTRLDKNHAASLYMMADCLAEGEGVEKDVAKAVPLFYRAAELGHRYARQRIRELLAIQKYEE